MSRGDEGGTAQRDTVPATDGVHAVLEPAVTDPAATSPSPTRRRVLRQYELVERVRAYDPGADEDLLNRAYVFAMRAHGAQKRANGDPYFHHPVEVAGILAGLRLDAASIATGLLHDTVEDTQTSLADIEKLFGKEVARLVDGVTKLNKLELQSAKTAQAENFRKLLLAMSEDIRVLLVKLADRLHNMRTLHFIVEPERRRRIAAETAEIYAPLAERIGMEAMKAELEDLAFAELFPDIRESIITRLRQLRRDDHGLIEGIVAELRTVLRNEGIEAEITGREKSAISIWRKMQRKNVSFEQLSDIIAFRVLVGSVPECYAALGVIHAAYHMLPGRFKDFISTPKPNGYRSLHTTIIGPGKRRIEIQIRTREMQEIAEFGVAAHWAYKQDMRVREGRQYRWIRELLDILEHASGPEEFLEHTKLEMFQDQVFCFTPKGDLIALPRGATPVDFAYAVHSQVGDSCVGAKVDGRIVQLRTPLKNGDQVEIITAKGATPSPAWERFVVTGKARARVRRFLRSKQRADFLAQGREMLAKVARAERIQLGERALERARQVCHQKSVDDLLVAVGDGSLAPRLVLEAIDPELKERDGTARISAEIVPLRKVQRPPAEPPAPGPATQPFLGLPPGVAFQFASCCHPLPGNSIVGVVRTGRAVAIHRSDCSTLGRVAASRLVDLSWNDAARGTRAPSRIVVMAHNRPGSLGTISTVIGKQGGNITDVRIGRRSAELYEMILDVEVESVDQLAQIQAALRASQAVSSVDRAAG